MNSNVNYVSPAESGKLIAEGSKYIKIKPEGISKLTTELIKCLKEGGFEKFAYGDDGLHPTSKDANAIDWIFVIDTLNFCFWSLTNKPKWTVNGHSGYYGLTAAIRRAIKEGSDITNPKFYSTITEEQLNHIMRPDDGKSHVSLLSTRLKCLHEVGEQLLKKYDGTFVNCIKEANKSAVGLLKIVVDDFPCFRDESLFEDQKVTFYKRAQILVGDVWSCYNGKDYGEFDDIDQITMFADYRIPQALVHFGVLEYDDYLMDLLKKDEILDNDSREIVEIRGCSIHAVQLISHEAKKIIAAEGKLDVKSINSILIDYFLWLYRREYAIELEYIPFHKVLCQYY